MARAAVLRVLADGHLSDTRGDRQGALEAAVGGLLGLGPERVRAFGSGSAAVCAALLAAEVRPGRRVLLSALAPPYVAGIVRLIGATAVPVDVDASHLGMASVAVAAAAGHAACILWTAPLADGLALDAVRRDLGPSAPPLIEDAAHRLGEADERMRPVGTRAFAGTFSLAYGKALGAGEGGLLAMPSEGVAAAVRRLDGEGGGGPGSRLSRLAALGRLPLVTSALALASMGELGDRRARRRAVAERLAAVAADAGVASFATTGQPLWAGRFPTALAARRAQSRAERLRLELVAPASWAGGRRALAVARDSVRRVRFLPWWDAGAARPAEIETLVRAFACALGAQV